MADRMSNVIKKTNLGIAVQQTILQLGLEREKNKILGCLQRAFQQRFQQFKHGVAPTSMPLKGFYVSDNQFPIGEGDKQQHFRCIAYNAKIGNNGNNLNIMLHHQKRSFTLIETFSKNQENKKRAHSKSGGKQIDAKLGGAPRKATKK